MENDDQAAEKNPELSSGPVTSPELAGLVHGQAGNEPNQDQIIEQSKLLVRAAASLFSKEKKLEAVKTKLQRLKSKPTDGGDNIDSPGVSLQEDEPFLNQNRASSSHILKKQESSVSRSPVEDFVAPEDSVRLDVEEVVLPIQMEDWALSSLTEQDMDAIANEEREVPVPQEHTSMQVVVESQPEDDSSPKNFSPQSHQTNNSWVDSVSLNGPKFDRDSDTARHQYPTMESISRKESKIQRLKEFIASTSSRKIGFGSATTQMAFSARSDIPPSGHSVRSLENGDDRSQSSWKLKNDIPSGRRRKLHGWGLVKTVTSITPSFLLSGKKVKKVRFNLDERKKKTANDKQRIHVIMEGLYKLGTYWNSFNLPTLIVCTWEVFIFPFRLALGPENEYKEIRALFSLQSLDKLTTNEILIVVNLLMDLIFILDITFKILGQAVLDEDDYQEKERELRKLRARRMTKGDKKREVEEMGNEQITLHYGPRTREFLRKRLPMYLFGCVFSYFPYAVQFSYWVEIAFQFPRLYRIILLFQFIRQKELDVYFEVRTVAFFKFCLTVFGVAHWIGCLFYWIPRVQGFPSSHCSDTWLYQFENESGVQFVLESSSMAEKYMVILYRGFNSITNLAYEPMVPRRVEEMIACTLSIFLQLFIEAYVLGTLFHYLVKKDTAQEEYAKLMAQLHEYSEARNLPKSLQDRLVSYFEFQKSKNIQDDGVVLRTLPNSLKMKFTQNKYSRVFEQNTFLFRGCNTLFLNQITVKLKEFYLMPGETMLRQGEMPRELCFVKMGIVEASKDGVITRRIRFDSEGATSLGEVAFFMGIAQREAMSAVQTGDVTLVIFSKLDYEDLMANYPEQHDIILTNLLAQYDLDKNGNEMGHNSAANEEDESFTDLQQAIQGAIQKRNSDALSTITYAASNGDVDTVRNLLARGVPINQGDYDNRTTLHLASSEGNLRVVEVLLQEGADPNMRDRWSGTPLSDAISNKRTQVVELLRKYDAKLVFEQPASMLCSAAAVDDIAMMEAFLQNGVDPNCSDYDQRTALHLAASEGMLRVSEFLIRSGTVASCLDRWGNTPLVDAVRGGHEMLIKLLRNTHGTLPKGFGGDTLCQACADGDIHMIELLLEAGVDVNTADYDQRSALHVAASEGQNADINAQDRWRSTALQDSLEGGYLDCAQLLSCFGGRLGDSANSSQMEALTGPECPTIEEVWAKIKKLNKVLSSNFRKGYIISTNMDEVVAFNHRVMMGMVEVLSKIKEGSSSVTEQLTMMYHSWFPVYDFCNLLVGALSHRSTVDIEPCIEEELSRSQGLSLDVTTLPAPRRQEKPECIPSLQIPGSAAPTQPAGPVISIFDNFDAILEEDARVIENKMAVQDSGKEAIASSTRGDVSDTKGRDVHRLLLKFGSVEQTLKALEDKLIQVAAYSTQEAVRLLVFDMDVRGENEALEEIYMQCRKSREDVSEDLIGSISVPGLLSSRAFLATLEKAASDPDTWMLKHSKPRSRQFVLEMVEAITLVKKLFDVFDDNNDGAVEVEELEALQNQMGTLMTDIMRSGLERYGAKQDKQLSYRQFSACILIYLDLEKAESGESESSESEGTWSNVMDNENELPEDEPLLREDNRIKDREENDQDSPESRIENAYSKVLDRRDTLEKASGQQKGSKLQEMLGKLWSSIATCLPKLSRALLWLPFTKKFSPPSKEDLSKFLNVEEFTVVVHQAQTKEEQVLTETEIHQLFRNFDTDGDGLVSFVDFRVALTEHLQLNKGIRSLLDTETQTASSGKFVIDIDAKWLVTWDRIAMVYLAFYYFFEVPFNISFRAAEHLGYWYFLWQHIMDVFLWIDIVLYFFRPYVNENSVLENSLGAIRRHYLGSYFPLDVATAFPIDLIVYSDGASHSYMSWLRVFRLLRVYRCILWRKQAAHAKTTTKFMDGLKRLIPIMFSASHILGCIWWYIGTHNVDENSDLKKHWIGYYQAFGTTNVLADANVLEQYILCFFWATASLSTNGQIGDSQPKSFTEMIFGCVIMLHSLTVYVYLLSELSDLVMNQDQELVVTRRQVQTVQNFIKANDIPSDLSQEIVQHFDIITSQSSGGDSIGDSIDIFSMLSHSLQVEVARNISRTLVETCYVFEGCDGNFIDSICVLLREVTVPPENYLFRINEVSKELYIIARGSVELMEDDETAGEVVSDTLEQGMLVGELGFFFGMRQTMHARTPSGNPSTLFGLDKNDYQQLAKLYPDAEEHITRNILEFWDTTGKTARSSRSARGSQSAKNSSRGSARSGRSPTADGEADDSMSAVREMLKVAREKKHNERIGRIIDAAAANDLEEVRRVFMGGDISIDESDYDDRTPLHLAASNGHLNMVKHLVIVHGADINVIDRYNGTPISDAVRGKHSECAKFLRQQGAALQLEDPAGEICQAAADGDLDYLKMLVENGIDPNVADYDSRTSLHLAASNNRLEILKYLCRIPSISINAIDRTGGTPLQDAVRHKHRDAQILLREAGGNFGKLDVAGVLCAAGAENNLEMIQIMYQSGVDMNSTDYDFRTALHLAASNGSLEVASFLLQQKDIDVNPVDRQRGTPLEDAIRHGQDVIHSLLKTVGGVRSDHHSLQKKLEENAEKRKAQIELNLKNRAQRVVESTHEHSLIKKLETLHSSLRLHSIDLQQNCVIYFDTLNMLVEASLTSKEWCTSLEAAEKRFHSSQKQILFRTKEIMKILSDDNSKECFQSKIVKISEPEMVALSKKLVALLPKVESSVITASDQAVGASYYFETFQEELSRRESEKRQAKVKRKIMKLGLQRKQTSMSEAAMEAILAEGPIIPGAVSPS